MLPEFNLTGEQIKEVFNRIQAIIKEYALRHKTMTGGDLVDMRDRLSIYLCHLGEISASFNYDYAKAYFNRVIMRAEKVQMKIMEQQMKITHADKTVDAEIKQERWAEMETSYFAERIDNLIKGANRLIEAIDRRITACRDENKRVQ